MGISEFEQGKDQLSNIQVEVSVTNSAGNLVDYANDIFEGEGELFLEDGILNDKKDLNEESWFVFMDLNGLNSGQYTYTLTFYDLIGHKKVDVNKTFMIEESIPI